MKLIIAIVIAYFLGNFSPSTVLAKAAGKDIKKEGSGNAGTTNALRVLGKKAAIITFAVDVGKGVIAVLLGGLIAEPEAAYWCALAVFLGHIWPALLKFKGGKGVAVGFGAMLAVNWQMALILLLVEIVVVLLSRMVSLGSVVVGISCPVASIFMEKEFLPFGCVMAAILIFKHRANIGRIVRGEESKLGAKKK
ncbi:MAG: glycerol-3-phosphate 1-O-acyltransferase PlsY [Eubacteriaceae bacterium]|nr:glycerol-3-phosphate 1-O-acyltransferase PlsY [Eubacteriaceae bacterium]